MSAFNWIEIEAQCPNCMKAGTIKCQTYVASSFDKIGERFCGETYRIGDKMSWFDKSDERYNNWKQGNRKNALAKDIEEECCYSFCDSCKEECFVIVRFNDCFVSEIPGIGLLIQWPSDFYKK